MLQYATEDYFQAFFSVFFHAAEKCKNSPVFFYVQHQPASHVFQSFFFQLGAK